MKPLIFAGIGEVLFDIFEDGTETLGGAPLNFAVHAHQLADAFKTGCGVIVSRIGNDSRGNDILAQLKRFGMSDRYISSDSRRPTGAVSVSMQNGEPGYQIESGAAWDYMAGGSSIRALAARCAAVCFGSLAQRSSVSRETIREFLRHAPRAIRLYDVNLRRNTRTGEPGYSHEIVAYGCSSATIIKANRSELYEMLDLLGIETVPERSAEGMRRMMASLLERFPARTMVVTLGSKGTLALSRDGEFDLGASAVIEATPHPVGAGDACSAGIMFGTALGWDIHSVMELANRMGADVAAQPSATPPLSDKTLKFVRSRLNNDEARGKT